jgi:hypothetical protein
MSAQKFKNTFAPHIKNTEFTLDDIRCLLKLAALKADSIPDEVKQAYIAYFANNK